MKQANTWNQREDGASITRRGAQRCIVASLLVFALCIPTFSSSATAGPSTGWQGEKLIEMLPGFRIMGPQVAMDGSGNAVAVWYEYDSGNEKVFSNRYGVTSGWSRPNTLSTDIPGAPYIYPQIAASPAGDMFVVWEQTNGTVTNIMANRYAAPYAWTGPTLIEMDDSGNAAVPQVAVDAWGDAVVVWQQFDGAHYDVLANVYTAGTGWGDAMLLETNDTSNALSPQVAVSPDGDATAVWQQSTYDPNGTRFQIWSNRYAAREGWGRASPVEANEGNSSTGQRVALDAQGNAIAVWQSRGVSATDIWANRFTVDAGWEQEGMIERDDSVYAQDPQISFDSSGDAIVAWTAQEPYTSSYNVTATSYVAGSGWGKASPSPGPATTYAGVPDLAMDADGNAFVVWECQLRGNGGIDVLSNRYSAASGWGTATSIEANAASDTRTPQVAASANGDAMAVWGAFDTTGFNVWANRFAALDATPPTLTVSAPIDGSTTTNSSLWVSGFSEPGASVSVAGVAAMVGADGSFGLFVALQAGANTLLVTAADAAGNRASASVTVTFTDPLSGLEGQLASAQATISTQQAQITSAQAALTAAQAREAALEANATTAKANLAAADARIGTLETKGIAAADVTFPTILAAVAIVVGGLACALAVRRPRVQVVPSAPAPSVVPPAEPPKP
jgi:hypothetical protein